MSCEERDRLVLALAVAANEGKTASEDLERATTDGEREHAEKALEMARNYCHSLRAKFLLHCEQHGC
jgi:hypothetical protein